MNIATAENEVIEDDMETILEEESEAEVMSEAERKHYEDIISMNIMVREAQDTHDLTKSRAKAAKEVLDEYSMRLSVLISEGPQIPDPQKELPFPDAEAWQSTPLEEVLKLTTKQLEKLAKIGITNMGQLEALRGGEGLRSVKGFGEKTIDTIENDIVEWLSKYAREEESEE